MTETATFGKTQKSNLLKFDYQNEFETFIETANMLFFPHKPKNY